MKGLKGKKGKRSQVIQIMVCPAMRNEIERRAGNLGLSISSYAELLIGKALSTNVSNTNVNTEEI
jgi:hypothetical protein